MLGFLLIHVSKRGHLKLSNDSSLTIHKILYEIRFFMVPMMTSCHGQTFGIVVLCVWNLRNAVGNPAQRACKAHLWRFICWKHGDRQSRGGLKGHIKVHITSPKRTSRELIIKNPPQNRDANLVNVWWRPTRRKKNIKTHRWRFSSVFISP